METDGSVRIDLRKINHRDQECCDANNDFVFNSNERDCATTTTVDTGNFMRRADAATLFNGKLCNDN